MLIQDYRKSYVSLLSKQQHIVSEISKKKTSMGQIKTSVDDYMTARYVLADVLRMTQSNFQKYVEDLGTLALKSVYSDRDLKMVLSFDIKRNKSECSIMIQEGDREPFVPKGSTGHGLVELTGVILRIIFWSLEVPRKRNTLILDEPFAHMGVLTKDAGKILKEITKELGIQVIIVTHDKTLIELADKGFVVEMKNGKSFVTEVIKEVEENVRSEKFIEKPVLKRRVR